MRRNGNKGNGNTALHAGGLTPQEARFAELVADPTDVRSLGDKGLECGWKDPKYGWKLIRRPTIAAKVEELVAENLRALRAGALQVLAAMHARAIKGDPAAASLYLKASGFVDDAPKLAVSVTQNNAGEKPFDEWLRDNTRDRFAAATLGPPSRSEDEE